MKIDVIKLDRPTLHIEEVKQSDGSFQPGDSFWSSVHFVVNDSPKKIVGNHGKVSLSLGRERWEFFDARIALSHSDAGEKPFHYDLIFDKVQRV